MYKEQCLKVVRMCEKAKQDYFISLIKDNNGSQNNLFKVSNKLFGKQSQTPLPLHENPLHLSEKFSEYFCEKIRKIRQSINTGNKTDTSEIQVDIPSDQMSQLMPVSAEEIEKLIHKSSNAQCELDPIPTILVKECLPALLSHIVQIINTSINNAEVPSDFKCALIRPLLKKSNLDKDILKNYRPISNLPFLSKILEKVVCAQLVKHMNKNCFYEKYQSAYRQNHSTETTLIKVHNDILKSLDAGQSVALVMLDLSAAFDTIDHSILIRRLERNAGVTGHALKWFRSYISDRQQQVIINEKSSSVVTLSYGVPQGSVLGPILFCIYTLPISNII
jgi:hypothetical protein